MIKTKRVITYIAIIIAKILFETWVYSRVKRNIFSWSAQFKEFLMFKERFIDWAMKDRHHMVDAENLMFKRGLEEMKGSRGANLVAHDDCLKGKLTSGKYDLIEP